MSTGLALIVLLSALMHAGWNFLIKASPDKLLDTVALAFGGSLVAVLLLPWVPLPEAASRPWLGVSVFIHIAYFVALVESYRHADLSMAYPLMRGMAPLLVALAAPALGEPLSPGLLGGIALVGVGIMLPAVIGLRAGAVARAGLWFALGNSAIIALYTVVDGIGVRLAGNAASYTLWLFFLDAWGILAVAIWRKKAAIIPHLRQRWPFALSGAVLTVGSYGIVLWAMSIASIPAVAALRETSVIFAALMGSLLLKEQMGRLRVSGAVLIAFGAALIRWA
jgi:drug/metabolite transporter (DMT)-like permease